MGIRKEPLQTTQKTNWIVTVKSKNNVLSKKVAEKRALWITCTKCNPKNVYLGSNEGQLP